MANVDLLEMPAPDAMAVIYHLAVEGTFNAAEESRSDAIKRVEEWLMEEGSKISKGVARSIDPDTWGLLPEHQSGLDLAMSLAGDLTAGGAE